MVTFTQKKKINYPSKNILIGDSRTDALPINLIEKYTNQNFQKLNTNATKLNEIFDLFYFSNEIKKIETLVIGINFSMFNKFSYENRVNNVIKIIENPFLYVFNKDIFEACFYVLRSFLFNINLVLYKKCRRVNLPIDNGIKVIIKKRNLKFQYVQTSHFWWLYWNRKITLALN